jgi:glycosyltransferase involved in cell wall biosynthesis
VPYEYLIDYICKADICLGIFGTSGKATRVIPNKVYQILAAGKPLVTGDTPAIRELLRESPTVRLVTPGSPESLASAVLDLRKTIEEPLDRPVCLDEVPVVGYVEVGRQLVELLRICKSREKAT